MIKKDQLALYEENENGPDEKLKVQPKPSKFQSLTSLLASITKYINDERFKSTK